MKLEELKVVFMGTSEFAKTILSSIVNKVDVKLVVTQPDSYVGRKHELLPCPVKSYAESLGIETFTPHKIREDYEKIVSVNPDIIITCAYGQIIPKVLLDLPPLGCINVHASLLPKLRGGAPIHHAIMDGLDETGVTIMYMDEHMDSGDIIKMESTPIDERDTLESLSLRLQEIGSKLLLEVLPSIINKTNDRIKQDESIVTYAHIITSDDEHIDFNKTSKEIYNQIRGLCPSPGSFFTIDDQVIKVYESRIGEKRGNCGEIISIYKDGIGIGTSDSEIIITKIKPAGKNIMDVSSYLNGIKKEDLLGKKCS